eukprot:scaffold15313_cov17-Tisochrysis_lutea.AAC.1
MQQRLEEAEQELQIAQQRAGAAEQAAQAMQQCAEARAPQQDHWQQASRFEDEGALPGRDAGAAGTTDGVGGSCDDEREEGCDADAQQVVPDA